MKEGKCSWCIENEGTERKIKTWGFKDTEPLMALWLPVTCLCIFLLSMKSTHSLWSDFNFYCLSLSSQWRINSKSVRMEMEINECLGWRTKMLGGGHIRIICYFTLPFLKIGSLSISQSLYISLDCPPSATAFPKLWDYSCTLYAEIGLNFWSGTKRADLKMIMGFHLKVLMIMK